MLLGSAAAATSLRAWAARSATSSGPAAPKPSARSRRLGPDTCAAHRLQIGIRGDDEAGGHRHRRPHQFAEIRSLPTRHGGVADTQVLEPPHPTGRPRRDRRIRRHIRRCRRHRPLPGPIRSASTIDGRGGPQQGRTSQEAGPPVDTTGRHGGTGRAARSRPHTLRRPNPSWASWSPWAAPRSTALLVWKQSGTRVVGAIRLTPTGAAGGATAGGRARQPGSLRRGPSAVPHQHITSQVRAA